MAEGNEASRSLEQQLARMRIQPGADLLFHALTLTADQNGRASISMHSEWVGWEGNDRRVELRQSRLVDARHAEVWRGAGLPCLFVTSARDLLVFLVAGGNALVERTIAEKAFPQLIQPRPCYPHGRAGFVGAAAVEKTALRRAPTPKLRMAVLTRDQRRCRICGRRPDDNVDITLHVHHIRPWESGGITDISNLITLCHTCHTGLDPHFDRNLFEYVEQQDALASIASFKQDVLNYRRASSDHRRQYSETATSEPLSRDSK